MNHRLMSSVVSLALAMPVFAADLTPGDILVASGTTTSTSSGNVFEYTPSGTLVQQFVLPKIAGADNGIRDLVVDQAGRVQIFTGTFTPLLTTLTPTAGVGAATYTSITGPAGWSTVNNNTYGQLAAYRNLVFATDMATASPGDPNGLIRFDTTTGASQRVLPGVANDRGDNIAVATGLNGTLYALYPGTSPGGNKVDVIDPESLTILRTITLGASLRGLAVDAAGTLYGAGGPSDGNLYRFNADGSVAQTLASGFSFLADLSIRPDGRLTAATAGGTKIVVSDTSLSSVTNFALPVSGSFDTFTAWVVTPVPEPAFALLLAGPVVVWRRVRRRAVPA